MPPRKLLKKIVGDLSQITDQMKTKQHVENPGKTQPAGLFVVVVIQPAVFSSDKNGARNRELVSDTNVSRTRDPSSFSDGSHQCDSPRHSLNSVYPEF